MSQSLLDFSASRKTSRISSSALKRDHESKDETPSQPPTKSTTITAPGGRATSTAQSRQMALQHMQGWIWALGSDHRFIGPLGGDGTQLKMPLWSEDGRKLTWTKFAQDIASKIAATNCPIDENDCWFVPMSGGDTAGYCQKKIWDGGEKNKWGLHLILHALKNPTEDENTTNDIAHRCRRGRYSVQKGIKWACINPFHTVSVAHAVNLDHNRCENGCVQLCPHAPKCIWTDEVGKRKKCRDLVPLPAVCACGAKCF